MKPSLSRREFTAGRVAQLAGFALAATGGSLSGQEIQGHTSQCDSLWEVSSRGLPDCPPAGGSISFQVSHLEAGCWSRASLVDLNATVLNYAHVLVYVHGNWMPAADARQRAWSVYRDLRDVADAPVCFIAYSWPSERREGFARDVRGKKVRLDADAVYLAQLLGQLPRSDLGLLGYSFGGPLICGALHMLGGGVLCGQLATQQLPPQSARVSLLAPAFDRSALTSRGQYGEALKIIDRLVNLYNSSDPILKRFRFFDSDTSPTAAGFAGILEPRIGTPLVSDPKLLQFDCRQIGRTHAELSYQDCSAIYRAYSNVLWR